MSKFEYPETLNINDMIYTCDKNQLDKIIYVKRRLHDADEPGIQTLPDNAFKYIILQETTND